MPVELHSAVLHSQTFRTSLLPRFCEDLPGMRAYAIHVRANGNPLSDALQALSKPAGRASNSCSLTPFLTGISVCAAEVREGPEGRRPQAALLKLLKSASGARCSPA